MASIVDSVRLGAGKAALEADKMLRIRREQGAIEQLRRDIKAQQEALGRTAWDLYQAGELIHPQLVAICQQIDALEAQIKQCEARIEQIRTEQLVTAPAGPTITCPNPNCRTPIPAGAAFCPTCGTPAPKPVPAGTVCQNCGASLPPAAAFCPVCGTRKTPEPPAMRCVGCGATLLPNAAFCPECGTRVAKAAPLPPVAPPPAPAPAVYTPPTPAPVVAPAPAPVEPPGQPAILPEPEPAAEWDDSLDFGAAAPGPASGEASHFAGKNCPTCHAALPLEAVFCPDCGTRLS